MQPLRPQDPFTLLSFFPSFVVVVIDFGIEAIPRSTQDFLRVLCSWITPNGTLEILNQYL